MYLIDAQTHELKSFNYNVNLPKFAVLSHRVLGEEILFSDISPEVPEMIADLSVDITLAEATTTLRLHRAGRKGWDKIQPCCEQALKDDIKYIWVGTCCVNNDSKTELSEAINTVFRWYEEAEVCYAYLVDVKRDKKHTDETWYTSFVGSSWFKSPWTLQELLAPKSVKFFDRDWQELGSRLSLSEEIAEATKIQLEVFTAGKPNLEAWSIAQRMSWASRREALLVEDVAYSLLGIFGVNMSIVYGEGPKAFQRLQEAIIKQSDDHTILAWSGTANSHEHTGVLASSPAAFIDDSSLVQHVFDEDSRECSVTTSAMTVKLPLCRLAPVIEWAGLNCTRNGLDQVGIFLVQRSHLREVLIKACVHGKWNDQFPRRDLDCQWRRVTLAT